MGAPAPEAPQATPAAPGGGAVGGNTEQIVQQISMLFGQLAQEEPDPDIQRLVKQVHPIMAALEQAVGKDETEDMSSGLHNPGGEEGEGGEGKKPAVTIAIHAGAPKSGDFGGAKKAAKAAIESGQLPTETERTMNKKKG